MTFFLAAAAAVAHQQHAARREPLRVALAGLDQHAAAAQNAEGQYLAESDGVDKAVGADPLDAVGLPHEQRLADAEGRDGRSLKPGHWLKAMGDVYVDKIILVGAPEAWDQKAVEVKSDGRSWAAKVQYNKAEKGRAAFAVIGRVGARIGADWTIEIS